MEVVQVLVELEESSSEPVDHNERVFPVIRVGGFADVGSDDCVLCDGDKEVGVG